MLQSTETAIPILLRRLNTATNQENACILFRSSIRYNYSDVNARLANFNADHSPCGYRNNFKPRALYVIEVDSVEVIQSTNDYLWHKHDGKKSVGK